MAQQESWTLEELREELQTWEDLLRARGYPDSTVKTYVGRSEIFLRWLAGDWPSSSRARLSEARTRRTIGGGVPQWPLPLRVIDVRPASG